VRDIIELENAFVAALVLTFYFLCIPSFSCVSYAYRSDR
jgi:hypothetical protein